MSAEEIVSCTDVGMASQRESQTFRSLLRTKKCVPSAVTSVAVSLRPSVPLVT